MKKYGLFLAVVFVLFFAGTSNALVQVEVLPPTTCVRGTGEPLTETFTFPGVSGQATVKLWNGSLEDDSIEKVSSSIVTVNGQVVFGPSEFNQNVGYLEKETTLVEGQNTLEVLLKGKPGGQITIEIVQEVEGEGAAFVGPDGGVVEVSDPTSPLYGVKVEISEDTVEDNTFFTISKASDDVLPPNDNININEPVEIITSVALNGYVLITCPLNTTIVEDDTVLIMYYDEQEETWGQLPVIGISYQDNTVIFATAHFTRFFVQKITYIPPDEAYTNFDVMHDCFNQYVRNESTYLTNHGYLEYTQYGENGICAGLANFALWYYFDRAIDESRLRCNWGEEKSLAIACKAFDEVYLEYWKDWANMYSGLVDFVTPYSSLKYHLMFSAANGTPEVLGMLDWEEKNGHAVIITGYKKTDNDTIEFYCYDVNYPMETKIVYCIRTWGVWSFVYSDYEIFYSGYLGDAVHSEFETIKNSYTPDNWCQDFDGDGIADDEDNCPNTPSGEPVNENGCSFSQLNPALSLPANSAVDVESNNITFEWQPVTHPGGDAVEYCVTVKEDAEPEDIPVFTGCDDEIFTSETSYTLPISLEPGKTYYWAVWARDDHGNWSEASEWWSFTTVSPGATLRVPADYSTIQGAIDAASDGYIVLVADGTYTGEGNKNLDFNGKAITVQSENGPDNCIIDCQADGRGFDFHSGEGEDSVVSGFTIKNGRAIPGGGIWCSDGSSPTITNCLISHNTSLGHGGGIHCTSNSSPKIINCTIIGNEANDFGGGICCWGSESPTIMNCTVSGNLATRHDGGGVHCCYGSLTIMNCIIWKNSGQTVDEVSGSSIMVTHSDVRGGCEGQANIDVDPLFVNPESGDYHLINVSPCIDSGTSEGAPNTDIEGTPRPQGSGYDMGAYEFTGTPYVPQPQVSSTSGPRGSTLSQPGTGFTPGGTAELHFRRPDGSLSPTTTELVAADGTYMHFWTVTPDAQIGQYQYWAIDLVFGLVSPEVDYWITDVVILQPGPGEGTDIWTTSVYSYAPGGGGPGGGLDNEELRVGGWGDTYLALIEFDLTGLPQYATSAVLELYECNSHGGTSVPMYLDRITEPWDWDRNDRLWWADRPSTVQWSPSALPRSYCECLVFHRHYRALQWVAGRNISELRATIASYGGQQPVEFFLQFRLYRRPNFASKAGRDSLITQVMF